MGRTDIGSRRLTTSQRVDYIFTYGFTVDYIFTYGFTMDSTSTAATASEWHQLLWARPQQYEYEYEYE